MNPAVCANCEHVALIGTDASVQVHAMCMWPPEWVHIVDARVHNCSQFRMAIKPPYQVPDQVPDQIQEPETAEVTE